MYSSLKSLGMLSTRFHVVRSLTIALLIFQYSVVTIAAQDSGGPKFVKPVIPNSKKTTGTETKSSTEKVTRTTKKKKQHPLAPALIIANSSLKSIGEVKDYRATFFKTELVRNRYIYHQARIKFRENPFSVYMGFDGANKGREVLYVAGRNNGKLIAKEAGALGIVGGVPLDPNSPTAMGESRYPITDIGMKNLVSKLIAQWERESKFGECNVKIFNGTIDMKVAKIKCKVVDSKHPRKRRQFGYHHTRLVVDRETNLPVRVVQYGFPLANGQKPPLIGKYDYVNIKSDVGLQDVDFDVRNREYNFR